MKLRYSWLGLGLATSLVVHPARAWAQQVSLSPTIGVYIPNTELTKAADDYICGTNLSVGLGVPLGNR
jgi:hypothetical protein